MTRAYEYDPRGSSSCELCGHPRIKHRYEIANSATRRQLWVGSECIKKFVPIFERGVEVVDEARRSAIVERIVSETRTRNREDRATTLLNALADTDQRFQNSDWLDQWKLGYSVRQLQLIAFAAREAELPFSSADFRINTRRGRVMEQLYNLEAWQYRRLRGALTPARRAEADRHFGLIERPRTT
jgi:hypothetical protein